MSSSIKIFFCFISLIILCGCSGSDSSALREKIDNYIGYWNTGNFNGMEEVLSTDFELMQSPSFKPQKGFEAFKKSVLAFREAYPDVKLTVKEMVFEKDKCAGIWTITATNPGADQNIKVTGISFIHFKDGKIKDEWISGNDLDWLGQLGYKILPPENSK